MLISRVDLLAYDAAGKGLLGDVATKTLDGILRSLEQSIINFVGHGFENETNTEKLIFGHHSSKLELNGYTNLPLRELLSVVIDSETQAMEDFTVLRNYSCNNIGTHVKRNVGQWGKENKLTGDWGWTTLPSAVVEAIYRLVCLEVNKLAAKKTKGSAPVKRIKQADGTETEFAVTTETVPADDTVFGDEFADRVFHLYRWKGSGGVA